jgi:hypothetical protein
VSNRDIYARDGEGNAPLAVAAKNGHADMVNTISSNPGITGKNCEDAIAASNKIIERNPSPLTRKGKKKIGDIKQIKGSLEEKIKILNGTGAMAGRGEEGDEERKGGAVAGAEVPSGVVAASVAALVVASTEERSLLVQPLQLEWV